MARKNRSDKKVPLTVDDLNEVNANINLDFSKFAGQNTSKSLWGFLNDGLALTSGGHIQALTAKGTTFLSPKDLPDEFSSLRNKTKSQLREIYEDQRSKHQNALTGNNIVPPLRKTTASLTGDDLYTDSTSIKNNVRPSHNDNIRVKSIGTKSVDALALRVKQGKAANQGWRAEEYPASVTQIGSSQFTPAASSHINPHYTGRSFTSGAQHPYDSGHFRDRRGFIQKPPEPSMGPSFPTSNVVPNVNTTHTSVSAAQKFENKRILEQGIANMKSGPLAHALEDIKKTFTDISKVASQAFAPIIKAAAPWTNFHTAGSSMSGSAASSGFSGAGVGSGGVSVGGIGGGHNIEGGGGGEPPPGSRGARGASSVSPGSSGATHGEGQQKKGWARTKATEARKQVGQQFWHAGTWGVVAPVIGGVAYTAARLVGGDPYTDRSIHALTGVGLGQEQKASTSRWAYTAAGAQPFLRTQELIDTHKMLISSAEVPYNNANAYKFEQATEQLQAYSGIAMEDPKKAAVDIPRATMMAMQNYAQYKGKDFFEVLPSVMGARATITQQSSVQGHDLATYNRYAGPTNQDGLRWSPGESEAFGAHYISRGATPEQAGSYMRNFFAGENLTKMAKLSLITRQYMKNAETMGFKGKAMPKEMFARGFWTQKTKKGPNGTKVAVPSPGYEMLASEKNRISRILHSGDKAEQLGLISDLSKQSLWIQKSGRGGAMVGKEADVVMRQMIASDSRQDMINNRQREMAAVHAEELNPTLVNKALDESKKGLDTPSGRLSEMASAGTAYMSVLSKEIGADKFFAWAAKRLLTKTVASNLGSAVKSGDKAEILKTIKLMEDYARLGKVTKDGLFTGGPLGSTVYGAKDKIVEGLLGRIPSGKYSAGWTDVQKLQDFYPDLPKDYFSSKDLYPNIQGSSAHGIPSQTTVDKMQGKKPVEKGPGPVGYGEQQKVGESPAAPSPHKDDLSGMSYDPWDQKAYPYNPYDKKVKGGYDWVNTANEKGPGGIAADVGGGLYGALQGMDSFVQAIKQGVKDAFTEATSMSPSNTGGSPINIEIHNADGYVKRTTLDPGGASPTNAPGAVPQIQM